MLVSVPNLWNALQLLLLPFSLLFTWKPPEAGFILYGIVFKNKVSHGLGWLQTCYVAEDDPELLTLHLAPESCTAVPS